MKVYICGLISKGGTLSEDEINKNLEKFVEAAERLRELGHEPTDPTWYHPKRDGASADYDSWVGYMRKDIKLLMDCDAIYKIPGWEDSRGARLESHIASELGLVDLIISN